MIWVFHLDLDMSTTIMNIRSKSVENRLFRVTLSIANIPGIHIYLSIIEFFLLKILQIHYRNQIKLLYLYH